MTFSPDKRTVVWFTIFIAGAVLVMARTELFHDEAYYWLCSRFLDWGYFDHPPLIAWLIALTAGWVDGEWGVRLGPFLTLVATAWIVGRQLVAPDRQWAWWAGWTVFPLLSMHSGLAVTDSAVLATAMWFLWALRRFIDEDSTPRALMLGICAALLIYAKYQGALVIAGAIVGAPGLLKRRSVWLAAVAGALLLTPHLHWQWQHAFPTFTYHMVQGHRGGAGLYRPLEFLVSQSALAGIFLAPWVWRASVRMRWKDAFERALLGIALTTLAVFFGFSFMQKVNVNWTVTAYLALLVLALRTSDDLWPRRRWLSALGIASVIVMLGAKLLVAFPVVGTPIIRLKEVRGWKDWAHAVDRRSADCALVANSYQIASKLSFYTARLVPSVNIHARPNQFDIWRWDEALEGPICWLTPYLESEILLPPPSGHRLWLVRNVTIEELRARRATATRTPPGRP